VQGLYLGSFGDFWPTPAVVFKECSMTAIGINGTAHGIIIAADGRRSVDNASKAATPDKANAAEGTASQKIFPLRSVDKNVAYVLAGHIANTELGFDAIEECRTLADSLRDRDFASEAKFVNRFSMVLTEQMNRMKYFPEFEKNRDGLWIIMDLLFAGYFKERPFVTAVQFYHSLHFAEFHSMPLPIAGLLYGSDVVRRKMYDDLGNVVSNSPFAEYIQNPREIRSLDESEKYVKGYIQACSSALALSMDESRCKTIGGHIHIAEITPASFKWRIAPVTASGWPVQASLGPGP
jgi:hypothetical protein